MLLGLLRTFKEKKGWPHRFFTLILKTIFDFSLRILKSFKFIILYLTAWLDYDNHNSGILNVIQI